MLQVLSKIAFEYQHDIAAHNYLLGPVILPFALRGTEARPQLTQDQLMSIKAAIECFPHIQITPDDKHTQMVRCIGIFTLDPNAQMAEAATAALMDHLKLSKGA